jgi:uncharacterized membrane protein YhhN
VSVTSWVLVMVMAVVAATDWYSVATSRTRLEYVAKPATMLALLAVLHSLDRSGIGAIVAALTVAIMFSLIGDVLLMLPTDAFVGGLASFAVAHLAYCVALVLAGQWALGVLVGVVVALPLLRSAAVPIVQGARCANEALVAPVIFYMVVITAMVTLAFGTGSVVAALGGALFVLSDALLGTGRFVAPTEGGRVAVHVTYHSGQLGLVLGATVFDWF